MERPFFLVAGSFPAKPRTTPPVFVFALNTFKSKNMSKYTCKLETLGR
jgi:hypothetical protein